MNILKVEFARLSAVFVLAAVAWGQAEPSKPATSAGPHYRVFRGDGTPATMEDLLTRAREADVVFLGESHDDPVAHELELGVLKKLSEKASSKDAHGDVILSLEMFERDVQPVLDEYLSGLITEREFLDSARPWKNYKTDYRSLIEFAKEHKIPVIAANAPGRYVNRVSRLGKASLEQLSKAAKAFLPPLPYADASSRYEQEFRRVMEDAGSETPAKAEPTQPKPQAETKPEAAPETKASETKSEEKKAEPSHKIGNFRFALESQSLWDAAMAYSIAQALKTHSGAHVVQVNGGFHSQYRLGILEHLSHYRPRTKSIVVTMEPEKDLAGFDQKKWAEEKLQDRGDFVVITDESLPRSGASDAANGSKASPAKTEEKK
jgi:uncharacterized iron-regulated protein